MQRLSKTRKIAWMAILLNSGLLLSACTSTPTEIAASEPTGSLELSLPLVEATDCARDFLERDFREIRGRAVQVGERRFVNKQESWVFTHFLWLVKLRANPNGGTAADIITTNVQYTKMGDFKQIERILMENCGGR